MAGNHLIGKHVWELSIGSSKNAYAMQQEVSEMIWKELVPKLNALFDNITLQNEVIALEKVELDLGIITLSDHSSKQIINKIVNLLREECFRLKLFSPNRGTSNLLEADKVTSLPLGQYHFESWIYWLETGTLPSYVLAPNEHWILLVLETLGLEHRAVSQMQESLKRSPHALRRLVLQHKEKDLKSIVELFSGHAQSKLLNFFKEVRLLLKREATRKGITSIRETEVALWAYAVKKVILNREKLGSEKLVTALVTHPDLWAFNGLFQSKDKAFAKRYPILLQAYEQAQGTIKESKDQSPKWRESPHTDQEGSSTPQKYESPEDKDEIILKSEGKKSMADSADLPKELELPVEEKEISTPQFFNNAGLVLLHPFLKHLFEKLKLVKDGAFKNFEKKSKAVLLLQYLATGQEVFGDYEMILPKFLCGTPANLPLDHTLKLSNREKKEANGLLQAAIDHWGSLGTTSPDGLREGFLMREGKLVKEEGAWKLFVEQKALDVLLDKLPWNLSMIKLPWMKEVLKVEWR